MSAKNTSQYDAGTAQTIKAADYLSTNCLLFSRHFNIKLCDIMFLAQFYTSILSDYGTLGTILLANGTHKET
jgi:hypothetical protein